MGKMFEFITRKPLNLFGGNCLFDCSYCWAKALIKRLQFKKYLGDWMIDKKVDELNNFKDNDLVFLNDMTDFSVAPKTMISYLWNWIRARKGKFLTLTKNPQVYIDFFDEIPENAILGATIESDWNYPEISKAPPQCDRMYWMLKLSQALKEKERKNQTFICIEPILNFMPSFSTWLYRIKPDFVAIGYDNYNHHLFEPELAKTLELIEQLEIFTKVYRKTLRPAWNEKSPVATKGCLK